MDSEPISPQPPNLITQLRGQHWVVKLIMIGIAAPVVVPLALSAAAAVADVPGVVVAAGACIAAAAWFMTPVSGSAPVPDGTRETAASASVNERCTGCGGWVGADTDPCPACGRPRSQRLDPGSLEYVATVLNDVQTLYREGRIDAATYDRLLAVYETRLAARMASAAAPAAHVPPLPSPIPPAPVVVPPYVPPPLRPVEHAEPAVPTPVAPAQPTFTVADASRAVAGWAAERQADILLYVGAFLLSVAAIIFVGFQGGTLSGAFRFAVLTVYAVGFLGFGLVLHRWERVREAGPVFLALGAILVPVDIIALRTQVLGEDQLPLDALWLLGSTTCAVLYFLLAIRGYGRLYVVPGVPAALAAWGALASVIGLPDEWFGPWFEGIAAAGYVTALALLPRTNAARWLCGLAVVLGAGALLYTHDGVLQDNANSTALPVAYLLATAGLLAGLRFGVDAPALAVLPPMAGMTVASSLWAAFDLDVEWYSPVVASVSLGYLLVAHFTSQVRARTWGYAAGLAALGGLLLAHNTVADGGVAAALPLTYAVVFITAAGAYGRWRWMEWAAALPPLAVMTMATTWWAADGVAVEWYGAFVTVGVLGYLLLAEFDIRERRAGWRWSATATGALALAVAHAGAVADPPVERMALPLTHGAVLLAAAASFARWRWGWRFAPAVIPALYATTAATAAWAAWDLPAEWYGALFALAAPGYLALSTRDEAARGRPWMAGAIAAGAIALGTSHVAQSVVDPERMALPATYAIVFITAALASAYWRLAYRESIATLPLLAAGLGGSFAWAAFDMRPGWLAAWLAAGAVGYLIPAEFDAARRFNWRVAALVCATMALFVAHSVATSPTAPVVWQLPVSYALVLAGSCWDAVRRCDNGVLFSPALASVLGATTLWAADAGPEWWAYPALGVATGMVATNRWWRWAPALGRSGWLYAVVLAVGATLVVLVPAYDAAAHGVATQLITAALLGIAAFGSKGSIARWVLPRHPHLHVAVERVALIQTSAAFVYGASASLNGVLDLHAADRAWTIAIVALAAWLLASAAGRRPLYFWAFTPIALAGSTIAAIVAGAGEGELATVLTGATVTPLVAFGATRRWMLLGVANAFLFLAVWGWWELAGLPLARLPVAFAAIAAVEWALLSKVRRYTRMPREFDVVIAYLSWVPWLISATVAGLLLAREQGQLPSDESLVTTENWAMAAAVLAMASAAVTGEGFRLRLRRVWAPGSAGLLVAALMGIATWEPENVQAYSAPIGAYLVALGLTYRTSPPIVAKQLALHEAVMLLGALLLVLPPAEQSFEPGGGKFGLELIGIGLALLAVGLVLHARWLVPAAILTLTGVSLRMVTGGMVSLPYWLLLGLAGTALLGFGMLVLLERERWDQFRARVIRWWSEASLPGGPLSPPTAQEPP